MGLRLCLCREETRFKGADTNGGTEDPPKLFSDARVWSKVLRAIKEKKVKSWTSIFCVIYDLPENNFGIFKEGAVDARDGVAFVTLSSLGGVSDGLGWRDTRGEEDLLGRGVVSSEIGSGGISTSDA